MLRSFLPLRRLLRVRCGSPRSWLLPPAGALRLRTRSGAVSSPPPPALRTRLVEGDAPEAPRPAADAAPPAPELAALPPVDWAALGGEAEGAAGRVVTAQANFMRVLVRWEDFTPAQRALRAAQLQARASSPSTPCRAPQPPPLAGCATARARRRRAARRGVS